MSGATDDDGLEAPFAAELLTGTGDCEDWQPIDLLLGQGEDDELARIRRQLALQPLRALELADTVALIEPLRQLRTEASPEFAGRMLDVCRHAQRFQQTRFSARPNARRWHLPLLAAAAAVVTFSLLCWSGVGAAASRPRATFDALLLPVHASSPAPSHDEALVVAGEPPREHTDLVWDETVDTIRERLALESSQHLQAALQQADQASLDRLGEWLDANNMFELQRLDHELRRDPACRVGALGRAGLHQAVDDRVQRLADDLAAELVAGDRLLTASIETVAWTMRALLAAGPSSTRRPALRAAGAHLGSRLPQLSDRQLVWALSALSEYASLDHAYFPAVARHGRRLVDTVLVVDEENWLRRRPGLLRGDGDVLVLGEAGRVLARLPAFGVDPERATMVRRLVLGHVRELRGKGQDRPEVLGAMLYGFADLLEGDGDEAVQLARNLRRWRLALLAPNFPTVQQIAWSSLPGNRGSTRLRFELRQLAVLPSPTGTIERAAFCLCLATDYAAYAGAMSDALETTRRS